MSNRYFRSDPKLKTQSNSINIPSTNGLSYLENRKIELYIDPKECQFFDPQSSYLTLEVDIDRGSFTGPLQLNPSIGGQVLIKNIIIRSGTGVELENIQNYNTYVKMKYDYEQHASLNNKRNLTEGTNYNLPYCFNKNEQNDDYEYNRNYPGQNGPILSQYCNEDGVDLTAKLSLPLHTGIFSNDKIFPNGYMDGLYITIDLEENKKCITDTPVNTFPPQFGSITDPENGAPSNWALDDDTDTFWIKGLENEYQCPFVVGQRLIAVSSVVPNDKEYDTNLLYTLGIIESITFQISGNVKYFKIVLEDSVNPNVVIYQEIDGVNPISLITSGDMSFLEQVDPVSNINNPFYTISRASLVIGNVKPPASWLNSISEKMKCPGSGKMCYDFKSIQNYKHSVLSSDTQATIVMPLNNKYAHSIISIPTPIISNNKIFRNVSWLNQFFNGITDTIQTYQWFYKNTPNPDRPVQCDIISLGQYQQQPLIETEKALIQGNVKIGSFLNFHDNFLISRAVSLNSQVCNLTNEDVQLNVEYSNPQENKLFNTFVFHSREIEFGADGISIKV